MKERWIESNLGHLDSWQGFMDSISCIRPHMCASKPTNASHANACLHKCCWLCAYLGAGIYPAMSMDGKESKGRPDEGKGDKGRGGTRGCRCAGSLAIHKRTAGHKSEALSTGQRVDLPACHRSRCRWMAHARGGSDAGTWDSPSQAACAASWSQKYLPYSGKDSEQACFVVCKD